MVIKNYTEGKTRKLRPEEMPTDKETIAAQKHTIKQLQEFIEYLPGWDYVKELKARVTYLEGLCKLKGGLS